MIKTISLQHTTADSYPFMSAGRQLDFDELGYVEEEYFFTGTANVYGKMDKEHMQVLAADAPYVNRFLVRRPADAQKASGRVVLEIVNTSSYIDIDRTWVLIHQSLLRRGDTWIGMTSKPITMKALRKFDPERYAALAWPNPRRCIFPAAALGNFSGASSPETEDGFLWDMLTELGLDIRTGSSYMGGIAVRQLYLIGWSQSGSDMIVYANWFARERNQKGLADVFDGYFCCAPGPAVCPGLNQEESMNPAQGDMMLQFSGVPFWQMQTESENAHLGTHQSRGPNSDAPDRQYRIYDIAGATHDAHATMATYYRDWSDSERTGIYLAYPGQEPNPNDFAYQLAFQAGYMCFCQWCEEGIAPPQVAAIPLRADLTNMTDDDGNALAGWRLPEIDCPVCTYQPISTPLAPGMQTFLYGAEIPFTPERLQQRYMSLSHYRALVEEQTDKAVAARRLDGADRQECIDRAVAKAQKYGLQ